MAKCEQHTMRRGVSEDLRDRERKIPSRLVRLQVVKSFGNVFFMFHTIRRFQLNTENGNLEGAIGNGKSKKSNPLTFDFLPKTHTNLGETFKVH